jgi:hypothetical protein
MQALDLNAIEVLEIVRVCGSLQVGKCPATFLRDYLAGSLVALDPDLAVKVRRFDDDQLDMLGACIQDVQGTLGPRRVARREAVSAVR